MKQRLPIALLIPAALAAAIFAGAAASSAAFTSDSCGTSGSGADGGSGTFGSGTECPPPPPPPYPTVPDRLYGVAGAASNDVWAVGLEPTSSLIMHWDGSSWTTSFTEPIGYFRAVSAPATNDVWAVGGTKWFGGSQTLAEHWNGTSWTQVTTPTPGSGVLNGVAATSASNAWAVGFVGPGLGTPASATEPLIDHWDGSNWTEQTFADPADGGQFAATAAISADDAWAVGQTGSVSEGTGQTSMIYHWDGSSWTRVPSPNAAGSSNMLSGVTAISADDVWAVGQTLASDGQDKSLTMHWNGSTWTIVSSPNPTGDTGLQAVAGASANDVWAVGLTNPTHCSSGGPKCDTIAMHWDGSAWTVVPAANPAHSYLNALLGIAVINGDSHDVWAVGTTDYESTLFTHWDGTNWH
ncbi:MAG TPA: hypothetical protein VFQ44_07680 [Streptosporangiaceae bacterium]|nr:hypothetical protein [Streptosporangiaceae bacterium]